MEECKFSENTYQSLNSVTWHYKACKAGVNVLLVNLLNQILIKTSHIHKLELPWQSCEHDCLLVQLSCVRFHFRATDLSTEVNPI